MNKETLETLERLSRLVNESTNSEVKALLMELMRTVIDEDQYKFDFTPENPEQKPAKTPDLTDPYHYPVTPRFNQDQGCQVCGIGANGESMGYVCTRGDCPTRVTCS